MKKRILSILLLCCMVLTLLPTAAFAAGEIDEQFTLAPGGTYYFDLSAMGIPGTVNDALPDKTMRYVPFTYAGTVDSYKLTSEMATTEEYAQQSKYAHSLFIADFAVTHEVSWDNLNAKGLIFGKNYTAGGVSYTLRAPSVGSDSAGSGDSQHGTPQSNEWDRILDKNDGYIKNWSRMHSWGQDISRSSWTTRAFRGRYSARYWTASWSESSRPSVGFRPVLEILNPGTLGSDGLKAVTLDLGGGKLGNSFKDIQIIVKKGSEFTAPASDGLTRPDGNADSYFQWLGSDGKLYAPGDSVPADVIKLTAQFDFKEQFTLAPGGVYYFDLSGVSIPGTANGSLPDKTMHYVPFTYAGTVDAYKLTSEMATTEEYAEQKKYPHSLFVADYAVTHAVSWDDLNATGLIFGKGYATGSVDYTLRAPSGGSGGTGSGALERGTPQSNEWDRILDKDDGYIKNWRDIGSWGQDTLPNTLSNRVIRGGDDLPRNYAGANTTLSFKFLGFRPVLEVLNPGTLGSGGLKAVTLDLDGGKLGNSSEDIQIIVKSGESFAAPASDGLTRPDGNTDNYFKWLGSDGELYEPGDNVSADVTKLTAQFAPSSHSVTITTDTLPDGKVGEAYSQILTATGTTPITWSISGGALPDGLSLNKDTGKISGTPTAAGSSTFTVKATNSAGSDTKELSITITKDAPPAHEHSYGDWRKDGTSHWHECTDDDCPNREESINDKAAHVYDDDADTTCDVCGYERTVTPPSHEHSYGDWSRDGTNHWHECTDDDCPNREESINDKAAHVYDDDADTTCDVCGYERTVTPPSHEHRYGDWRKDGTNHWHECTDADCPNREESIKDKAAHVYTDDADTTCDVCGYERTVTPPSHEHSYGDWRKDGTSHWHECTDADCPDREESIKDKAAHVYTDDADTTCDTCGYERTITPPAHEHRYGDWRKDGTNHWHECTDADCPNREESIKDKAAHVYDNDADTTCNTCGYERTITPPAHEHRYGDWRKDGTNHWHECTDADCPNREESIKDKAAHVYDNDADTTCNTCGYERTITPPAHEHRYGDWRKDGTNHWHECTDADCPNREESIKDKAAHVYDNDADTTCNTCGYERTITPPAHEHRYGDWRKDGTNHWHECTDADCPNREESIKDKAAHVYDNDADTTCNTCGYERTVTPPAHEHIVTFDGNGGTSSVGSMTTTNQKLTSLPSASRSGSYSFDGWYTEKSGGTKITTDTVFSANTTVYAHWTYTGGGGGGYNPPVTYYTLRFETGGGSDIPSVQGTYNTYIDLTKYVPTWRGHTFIGWYSERSLMNKVSGVYLTKDMTVYAGWRVNENPGTGANPFTDVSEKDWFYGDVMFVYENGLMLGTSKTLFSPHGTATRGMMATILWRMEGSPVPKGKNSFTDVEAGKWYADAITWTAENGIFAGYGKDKFGPDDPITREQLAAIFYRYADYKGYDLTVKGNLDKFKDADKITDYAKTAMQWAVGSGLVKGKSGNLLDPQGTATRAEIAAMLHRFIEKYELVQGKAPGGLMGWIDPKRLQIPKTGDSSVLGLWGISLCTSLAGCLALTTWQIRRRREEESLQIIEK